MELEVQMNSTVTIYVSILFQPSSFAEQMHNNIASSKGIVTNFNVKV